MNDIETFERILESIGYKDDSTIFPEQNKKQKQTVYKCTDGGMAIYSYIIPYYNKKSYVYLEFLDTYELLELEEVKVKIKNLCNHIRFEEKTRIGEIGWEVVYTKSPDKFTLKERRDIFFSFLRSSSKTLKGQFNLKPEKGDILAARPHGPKINQGFTEDSMKIGIRQRIMLGKKFNFGDIKEDGFQYAMYDDQGNLHPI